MAKDLTLAASTGTTANTSPQVHTADGVNALTDDGPGQSVAVTDDESAIDLDFDSLDSQSSLATNGALLDQQVAQSTLWDDALLAWEAGCEESLGLAVAEEALRLAGSVEDQAVSGLASMALAGGVVAIWRCWETRPRGGDRRRGFPRVFGDQE